MARPFVELGRGAQVRRLRGVAAQALAAHGMKNFALTARGRDHEGFRRDRRRFLDHLARGVRLALAPRRQEI